MMRNARRDSILRWRLTVTLAQRRVLQDFETNQFPALKTKIDEAAGSAIPVEVNWESLAVPNEERLYAESWTQVYFEPLIAALKDLTRDDMGREAAQNIKKIVIQNTKDCRYGSCWASFADGVLTLDHQAVENAYDVDGRAKGLTSVLEQSL